MGTVRSAVAVGVTHQLLEQRTTSRWNFANHHVYPNFTLSLEEEIHMLRSRMEELFEQEQCLTSPCVVEASNILDAKINEYMLLKKSR